MNTRSWTESYSHFIDKTNNPKCNMHTIYVRTMQMRNNSFSIFPIDVDFLRTVWTRRSDLYTCTDNSKDEPETSLVTSATSFPWQFWISRVWTSLPCTSEFLRRLFHTSNRALHSSRSSRHQRLCGDQSWAACPLLAPPWCSLRERREMLDRSFPADHWIKQLWMLSALVAAKTRWSHKDMIN